MLQQRRDFIKAVGLATAGLTLPFTGKSNLLEDFATYKKLAAFGIQLWTVKEAMDTDAKGTLAKLASYGYKQIESFDGPKGMYWGMKNREFKKYMDGLGMKLVSSHCENTVDFDRKAAEAAEIGVKYLICAYKGPQKSLDNFKQFNDEFNKCGETCNKNGIRFAYHNHDYSFKLIDGQMPQTIMMEGTDASLVDFEMDIYWVVAAKEDPQAWLKKYPNRFKLCHVKDQTKTATGIESCQLGKGAIDFKTILATAKKQGMQYYIAEQEDFSGSTPMLSAEVDAAFLKKLTF